MSRELRCLYWVILRGVRDVLVLAPTYLSWAFALRRGSIHCIIACGNDSAHDDAKREGVIPGQHSDHRNPLPNPDGVILRSEATKDPLELTFPHLL